jgi:hypothetical protein
MFILRRAKGAAPSKNALNASWAPPVWFQRGPRMAAIAEYYARILYPTVQVIG